MAGVFDLMEQSYIMSRYAGRSCAIVVKKPKDYDVYPTKLWPVMVCLHGQGEFAPSTGEVHVPNLLNSGNVLRRYILASGAAATWDDFIIISIQGGRKGQGYYSWIKSPFIPIIEAVAVALGYINPRTDGSLAANQIVGDSRIGDGTVKRNSSLFKTLRIDRDRMNLSAISQGGEALDIIMHKFRDLCAEFGVSVPAYPFVAKSYLSALGGMRMFYSSDDYPLTVYKDFLDCYHRHDDKDPAVGIQYSWRW